MKGSAAFARTKWESSRIKSAAIVHEVKDGKLVAAKINGSYWMYFGESSVHLASSVDFIHWKPIEDSNGAMLTAMKPRKGYFKVETKGTTPHALLLQRFTAYGDDP